MSIRALSTALQQKAETELNESPRQIQEDLQHIKNWLAKQPHLRARTEDQWLLSFLRSCKFSLQRTKEKLDLYYTMRSLLPEFFSNRDPLLPEIQEFLKRSLYVVLPKTADPSGPRLSIFRVRDGDSEKVPVITAIKAAIMTIDICINEDDNSAIAGQEVLIDLLDPPYKYISQITPALVKKTALCLQSAYPVRPKGLHFINTPPIFEPIFKLIKQFLKPKMLNRIKFYSEDNLDDLYKTIPLSVLPKEYGGEGESIDKLAADWKLKVESYRDWFLEDAAYYSDETKRPGEAKTFLNMFGMEGSFKKLNID